MKITLDKEKCIGCGSCVAICDDFFEMGQESKAHLKGAEPGEKREEVTVEEIGCAQEAADICAVQAIGIEK